jgi:hypothetical protein
MAKRTFGVNISQNKCEKFTFSLRYRLAKMAYLPQGKRIKNAFCAVASGAEGWKAIAEFGFGSAGVAAVIHSPEKRCAFP